MTGYLLAIGAAILWGASGTAVQFLFQDRMLTPEWLVSVRLFTTGLLLLALAAFKNFKTLWAPFKNKKDTMTLLIFSVFGMLAVQYTFFAAIQHSNAATATILQFTGPLFIASYYAILQKRWPSAKELWAIASAFLGTFLIVTHGDFREFSINASALFWGIASALALATYSILPSDLLRKYDTVLVVGWGMFIAGVIFSAIHKPWIPVGIWDQQTYLMTVLVVLLGTALPFIAYLKAVQIVGATVASLLSCAEPLSAALIALVWLKTDLGLSDALGMIFIFVTVWLLTQKSKKPKAL